jgi:carboxymethylenebutenolidase
MGQFIKLTAADGHHFSAYDVKPAGKSKGGIVLIQEIFGVNAHIRGVADGYAADGYHVIAPAIFDRVERDFDRGYEPADREAGIAIMQKLKPPEMLADIAAVVQKLAPEGKVAVVGYCLGGSLAYLAASQVPGLTATVGYYGGMIAGNLDKKPKIPVLLHFGELDQGISMDAVEKVKASVDPKLVQVFVYPDAGHAFNRAGTPSWHEPSAKLARERTVAFLKEKLG